MKRESFLVKTKNPAPDAKIIAKMIPKIAPPDRALVLPEFSVSRDSTPGNVFQRLSSLQKTPDKN